MINIHIYHTLCILIIFFVYCSLCIFLILFLIDTSFIFFEIVKNLTYSWSCLIDPLLARIQSDSIDWIFVRSFYLSSCSWGLCIKLIDFSLFLQSSLCDWGFLVWCLCWYHGLILVYLFHLSALVRFFLFGCQFCIDFP